MPELVIVLFLDAGAIKDASWLSGLPVDLTVLSAAAVLLAIVARALDDGVPTPPPAAILMVALVALVLLSVLWSPDQAAGLSLALRFETLTLLAFAAPFALIRTHASFIRLMIAFVALGTLIAATAVPSNDVNKPLTVPGGIEIELGLDVGAGLLAAVGYLALAHSKRVRLFWLAPAGFLAWIVVASGSRGAVVAGGTALLFIFFRYGAKRAHARRLFAGVVAAVVVAFALGGASTAGLAMKKYEAVLFTTNTHEVLGLRMYLLEQGWQIALAHPMGIGAAGFHAVTDLNYPHDILLELWDEHGMLAVGLFVGLVASAWHIRRRTPGGIDSPEAIVVGALIIFFLLEALGSLNINQDKPLWFVLGLALALPRLRSDQ
jgi:O-Antigen ligase.